MSVKKILRDQRGQVLPLVAICMIGILGMGGLVIDVGHAYQVTSQLQNSANAAALAAAGVVFDNTGTLNPTNYANAYSSAASADENFYSALGTVTTTVTTKCLNMLIPSGQTSCAGGAANNAVQVTQSTTVPTFFMRLFGKPTLTVGATATASMMGTAQKWNIAIVLDSTPSMNDADPNCGAGMTEFQCATLGIQMFLGGTSPCAATYTTCAAANANFHVALFTFPGVATNTVADDSTNCGTTPNYMLYSLPQPGATSYMPPSYTSGSTTWTSTYEIIPFSSDYYSSTAPNHLNTNSPLVQAVTGCMTSATQFQSEVGGLYGSPSGTNGGITYFAPAIYAAQSALIAERAANPGTQNAIIFLSDGQANVTSGANDFPSQQGGSLSAGSVGYTTPGSNGPGVYPDFNDECQQAIVAAQYAASAGTRVYAVSYGAEGDGCSYTFGTTGTRGSYGTDNTTVATGNNAPFTAATITPCITMENIASSLQYFYSDYNQADAGTGPDRNCIDNSHAVSSLNDIFMAILADLTKPRLLPNNAT